MKVDHVHALQPGRDHWSHMYLKIGVLKRTYTAGASQPTPPAVNVSNMLGMSSGTTGPALGACMSGQMSCGWCSQRANYVDRSHSEHGCNSFSVLLGWILPPQRWFGRQPLVFFRHCMQPLAAQKAICDTSCDNVVTSDPRLLLMLGLAGSVEASPAQPHVTSASSSVVGKALWEFTAMKYKRSVNIWVKTTPEEWSKSYLSLSI